MADRFTIERALRVSTLGSPGRLLALTLLTWTDHATARIPAEYTPSLAALSEATGMAKSSVTKWLATLQDEGWLIRWRTDGGDPRSRATRTRYGLAVPPHRTSANPNIPTDPDTPEASVNGSPDSEEDDLDGAEEENRDRANPASAGPATATGATPPSEHDGSDLTTLTCPPDGHPPNGRGPSDGQLDPSLTRFSSPPDGHKTNIKKPNRGRAPARTGALAGDRAREDTPPNPAGRPATPGGRITDHRYVEGVNGYCAVAGCGRSSPMHPAPLGIRRRTTPLRWQRSS